MRAKIPPRVVNTLTLFAKVKMYAELARNRKKYRIKSRYDNNLYAATLHKGERVMTAKENRESSNGGGANITIKFEKLADTVNASNPADVDTLIDRIATRLTREMGQMA